jgi:excisionase family DNA binding protein
MHRLLLIPRTPQMETTMSKTISEKVMTLAEAAKFLRVSAPKARALAEARELPGRKIGEDWRFLHSALVEWLRPKPTSRDIFLQQAGALADDDTLPELLASIYKSRGRPEVDPED